MDAATNSSPTAVLLVDDNPAIIQWQSDFLTGCGLQPVCATSAEEALELCRSGRFQFRCIVSDMSMPGKNGHWLAQQCLAEFPRIPMILSTGYIDVVRPQQNIHSVLIKPYGPSLLLKSIRDAIAFGMTVIPLDGT